MKLTTQESLAVNYFSQDTFKGARYIDGLYMVEFYKKEIVYNKPIYVGTSVLDLSTLTMIKFHYDVIHKSFRKTVQSDL